MSDDLKNKNSISRKLANWFFYVFFIVAGGVHSAYGANITIDDATVTETSGGTFIYFDVNIDAVDTSNAVTINYTVNDGTATNSGGDFDNGGGSGSVTLAKFQSTVQIGINTNDDSVFENTETFSITLNSVSHGHVIRDSSATGTILDNEVAPTVNLTNAALAGEGSSGNVVDITLSHAAKVDIDVDFAFSDGTAVNGVDYTGVDGTATIPAGSIFVGVPATTITDGIDEARYETFTVTISNPTVTWSTLGSTATETINIVDVDGGLSIDDVIVSEGAGNASVTVTLQGPTAAAVTVDYSTADSSAMAGSDYSSASGRLTFAGIGDSLTPTTQTFTVPITDDSTFEGSETFTISLSNVSGAAVLTDADAAITITDNDAATGNVSDAELSSAIQGVSDVFQIDNRRYNIRMADQSRKIVQISMNTSLSGDCGSLSSHSLCGASNVVNKAITNRDNSTSTNTKVGIPDVDISGGDDGTNGKISFVNVDALLDDGAKRIVSVTADFSENKNGSDTDSIMVSYARETFDPIRSAAVGIFTHLHRAKTNVKGVYGGKAKVEGFNVGLYVNNFSNENYVTSGYASVGYSESAYKLSSAGTFINNRFDTYNTQAGVSLMGKQELGDILFMPKFTLDAFVTMQEKSAPKVVVGSAERVGFLTQRVLTELQVGFRPHVTLDLSQDEFDSTLDLNPQIFCGYAANLSDCGWGLEISSATKPDGENTEYKLDLGYESYRDSTTARVKIQMESNPFGTKDVYSATTLTNDFIDMSIDGVRQNPGVEWEFGVRY